MGIIKNIFRGLVDSIFVNFKCMFCNTETVNESLICPDCEKKLKAIRGTICLKCGTMVEKSEDTCYTCFDKKYAFNKHRSCFIYDDLSSTPVKLLKYSGKKYLAEPIARVMYAFNKDLFSNVDVITFVPMTDERKKDRGYNQCKVLAKELSNISNISVLKLLVKSHETEHQADLNFEGRIKNLKGSFEIDNEKLNNIKGKNILLIDDVFTTGSTLHECSRILFKGKAKSVSVLTFIKTDPFNTFEELPF